MYMKLTGGQAKAATIIMFSFSANGEIVPSMIIYPYKRLPSDIFNSIPKH